MSECSHHFYFDKPTNDLSSKQANFDGRVPYGKGEKGPYLGRTTRVGAYPPNKLGLCDMHGNIHQWTDSLYDPKDWGRVSRGGSWGIGGFSCQAANRLWNVPSYRGLNHGFRLARVPVR